MADCEISLKDCDPKIIARQLRQTALRYDVWAPVRQAAFWFGMGMVVIASLDFGDVWLCVGQCSGMQN